MILSTNAITEEKDLFDPLEELPGNLGEDSVYWWLEMGIFNEKDDTVSFFCGDLIDPSIDSVLRFLSNKIGATPLLEWRDSSESFSFDGKSIGLISGPKEILPSARLLHEICHWVVAEPWQRIEPEFGLSIKLFNPRCKGIREKSVISNEEQVNQEIITQMLTIYLGEIFNVPIKDAYDGRWISWESQEIDRKSIWNEQFCFGQNRQSEVYLRFYQIVQRLTST